MFSTAGFVKGFSILGGGPAGAAAAIAARGEGSDVTVIEKSAFPRHKVCGEFLSPEIAEELEKLGAWEQFLSHQPARVRRMKLHFGRREKAATLPEPAWGLSRYAFDHLLLERAKSLGASLLRESDEPPRVIAQGRSARAVRGARLFGFKTHFEGPADDAVELYFFEHCYVGVSPVENGRTNVCGLGPEDVLLRCDFDFDRLTELSAALSARLRPLRRSRKWLTTGPLRYEQSFGESHCYCAGDALSFVDPFTGSGLLAALKTGSRAGIAAARGESVADYAANCRAILKKPFEMAEIFRSVVDRGWADSVARLVPGRLLFILTRPR
jgi:menaquinone-9 beta-reductase